MTKDQLIDAMSCDLAVATGSATADGSTIFAKNSDRPIGECQPLLLYPAQQNISAKSMRATYIDIPQVESTCTVYGSHIYNIFGCEHGTNEHGVAMGNIGNIGVEPPELTWGLLGMDILTICLQRAKTADEALDIAIALLEKHGSGGNPKQRGIGHATSYIIADATKAWRFTSMNRHWVAKEVTNNVAGISNVYDIGSDFDRCSAGIQDYVVQHGYLSHGAPFDFAKAFIGDYSLGGATIRANRINSLLTEKKGSVTVKSMMNVMRDHYEGSICAPRHSPYDGTVAAVCMHGNVDSYGTSTANMVAHMRDNVEDPFKIIYWGCMAPPCVSVYQPYFNVRWLPEDLAIADALYSEKSPWWVFNELERYVSLNYNEYAPPIRQAFDKMEDEFIAEAGELERNYDGNVQPLKDMMLRAHHRSFAQAKAFRDELKLQVKKHPTDRFAIKSFRVFCQMGNVPYDKTIFG